MPSPDRIAKTDQFHRECRAMFDYYVSAIETDMNRFRAEKGEPMDPAFAHNDITRLLTKDVNAGALAGMLAASILTEIGRKGRGGKRT